VLFFASFFKEKKEDRKIEFRVFGKYIVFCGKVKDLE
jgi:hypothetical protein